MWTQFSDAHSGGRLKTAYEDIYIEAPKEQAKVIFRFKFGVDPDNEFNDGGWESDYNIYEAETVGTLWEMDPDEEFDDEGPGKYVIVIRRDQILDAMGV